MKNGFDRLISKLNLAKERLREFENSAAEISQTETEREKRMEIKQRCASKSRGTISNSLRYITPESQKERRGWG